MVTIESTTVVQRPVNMVFNFTADVDNLPLWMHSVLSARRLSHGPLGVGARFRDRIGLLGRSFESDFELTAYEPGRRLAFRSVSGPFPLETDERFEPLGDDTRVTMTVRAEPGGFFRVAQPVLQRMLQRQLDASLANVKDLLGARRGAPSGSPEASAAGSS
jgi:uncharacterized membrane protein